MRLFIGPRQPDKKMDKKTAIRKTNPLKPRGYQKGPHDDKKNAKE